MSDWTRWAGEAIGVVGLLWLIMFIGTYARHAYWRKTPEGRSVMYLAVGLAGTILLLIIHGLTGAYPGRWAVEVVVFSALAVACWNLHYTLRRSLGLKVTFLFLIRRKPRNPATRSRSR